MKTEIAKRQKKIRKKISTLSREQKADFRHRPHYTFEEELRRIERVYGAQARTVIETLALFGIEAKIQYIEKGPAVDRVVFDIPHGTRCAAVKACRDNIMCALRKHSIRIDAPISGSDTVSVEFPHD